MSWRYPGQSSQHPAYPGMQNPARPRMPGPPRLIPSDMRPGYSTIPSPSSIIARQDRIQVWSLPYFFVLIIGIGSLFTFFDITDLNVSFIQTCVQIIAGCHAPTDAVRFIGLPVLVNLACYVIGALVFGPLADRFGRRDLMLVTLVVTGLGSLFTAFAASALTFTLGRAITGLGIGADIAVVSTYVNEVAPRTGRARYITLILILAAVGSVAGFWSSLVLATPPAAFPFGLPFAQAGAQLQGDGWRIVYGIGALLAVVGVLVRTQLPESPRWLVAGGRIQEADTVVRSMERRATQLVGRLPMALDEVPVRSASSELPFFSVIRNPRYLKRVLVLLSVWLLCYVTVYWFTAGLSSTLASLGYNPSEAGLISTLGASGFLFGCIAAYFLGERLERNVWLPIGALLTLTGGLVIAITNQQASGQIAAIAAFGGAFIINFGLLWLGPTYAWTSESFPTRARATGFALVDGLGHIGGGIGVFILAPLLPQYGALTAFLAISLCMLIAALLAQFGPPTRGRRLDIISP
ncbi:MAG: MFS transporter [Ktedonobacterales bacterium]